MDEKCTHFVDGTWIVVGKIFSIYQNKKAYLAGKMTRVIRFLNLGLEMVQKLTFWSTMAKFDQKCTLIYSYIQMGYVGDVETCPDQFP